MAHRLPQSPLQLPGPTTPADIQHNSPPSSLISKKIILKKIVLCAVYPNATSSHFCQSCSSPPSSFDFFLGFALGLASLNQNNSHNAWGERFLWVNDICMKRRQSCRFLSFEDACQPVRGGVSDVTRGDCGDAGNSFFPESLQPKLWALWGPGSSIHFLKRLKAMLVVAAGIFTCVPSRALQQCFVAHLLCLSWFNSVPFFPDSFVPPQGSGSSRQTPERRGEGVLAWHRGSPVGDWGEISCLRM